MMPLIHVYRSLITFLLLSVPTALAFTSTTVSFSTRNRNGNTFLSAGIDVDEIESRAIAASEAWDVDVTAFLSGADAAAVEAKLMGRADVACFRVGASRARFVFTNPELGMDTDTAEAEHCTVLRIENAKWGNCDPWPNLLTEIGVDLNNVGDVVVVDGSGYLVVAPEVAKQCSRLLPKVVVGAGVIVKILDAGTKIPDGGVLQDMEVQRLDKRSQKRNRGASK